MTLKMGPNCQKIIFFRSGHDAVEYKMYYLMFSDAVSRMTHIEWSHSRYAHDIIKALKCFFSRRSTPRLMISDNEGAFQRSGKEVKRLFTQEEKSRILGEMASLGVEFKFKYEYSPHYNSLCERIHAIANKMTESAPCLH